MLKVFYNVNKIFKRFISFLTIICLLFTVFYRDYKFVYAYDGDVIDWLFDMAKTHNLIAESNRIWNEVSGMPTGVGITDVIKGTEYAKDVVSKRLNELTIDVSNGIDAVRNTFNNLTEDNKTNIVNLYEQYNNQNILITNEIYNELNLYLFDEAIRDKKIMYYNPTAAGDKNTNHSVVYTSPSNLPNYIQNNCSFLNDTERAVMGVGGGFWSTSLPATSTAYSNMERFYIVTCTGLDPNYVSLVGKIGANSFYINNKYTMGSLDTDRVSLIFTWSSKSPGISSTRLGRPVKFYAGYPAINYPGYNRQENMNSLMLKFVTSNGQQMHTDFCRLLLSNGTRLGVLNGGLQATYSYDTTHTNENIFSTAYARSGDVSSYYSFFGNGSLFNINVVEFVLNAGYGNSYYYDDGVSIYNNSDYMENVYNYDYYVTNNYYNDSSDTDSYNYVPSVNENNNYYDYITNNDYTDIINNYINNNDYKGNTTTTVNNYYQINNYIEPTPTPEPTPPVQTVPPFPGDGGDGGGFWDWLFKIADTIINFIGSIFDFLFNLAITLVDMIKELLLWLFVPSDNFWIDSYNILDSTLKEKLPYDKYIEVIAMLGSLDTSEDIVSFGFETFDITERNNTIVVYEGFEDYTFTVLGVDVVLPYSSYVNQYLPILRNLIRSFFYILLAYYNYRQFMFLIRGTTYSPIGNAKASDRASPDK